MDKQVAQEFKRRYEIWRNTTDGYFREMNKVALLAYIEAIVDEALKKSEKVKK